MHTPPPDLVEAVERAAELRAVGNGWERVARELGMPVPTIRGWSRTYREYWDQLSAIFGRSWTLELRTEAFGYLQKLLRSGDEKVCQIAAKELIAATEKIALPQNNEPAPMSELCRFAARLEELSDDELAELLDADRRREAARSEAHLPLPSDSESPT
jgi:hypothetical protein